MFTVSAINAMVPQSRLVILVYLDISFGCSFFLYTNYPSHFLVWHMKMFTSLASFQTAKMPKPLYNFVELIAM